MVRTTLSAMSHISDALQLLTKEHEELDELFARVSADDVSCFRELADKLTTHLAIEQELLYPAIQSWVSRDVLTELLDEHIAIKRVLADLVWLGPEDDRFKTKLADLGMLLAGHVGWQEDELFTRATETMSQADLDALCDLLQSFDSIAAAA